MTFVHLERGSATSEHKIRNNRRWFSSFKFLRILHCINTTRRSCFNPNHGQLQNAIQLCTWYLVLWKTQMLVLFGKSYCCTSCVMVIPIQVDWLASTSAAGFATHEQTEDNERWAAGPSLQNSWRGCIQELVSTRTMHHARVWIIDVIEHGHVYTGLQKGLWCLPVYRASFMRKRTAQLCGNGAGLNLVISQSIFALLISLWLCLQILHCSILYSIHFYSIGVFYYIEF